jgi:hypothetical protein
MTNNLLDHLKAPGEGQGLKKKSVSVEMFKTNDRKIE